MSAVKIQENILNTIFQDDKSLILSSKVDGTYIPGFGVVFSLSLNHDGDESIRFLNLSMGKDLAFTAEPPAAPEPPAPLEPQESSKEDSEKLKEYEASMKEYEKAMKEYSIQVDAIAKVADEINIRLSGKQKEKIEENEKKFKEEKDKLSQLLKDYISDYATVIPIPDNENLLIRGNLETFYSIDDNNYEFQITVSGKDLQRVRNNQLSKKELADKIIIREYDEDSTLPIDILIMKNILKTISEKKNKGRSVIWFGEMDSWISYIENIGALYCIKYPEEQAFFIATGLTVPGLDNTYDISVDSKETSDKEMEATITTIESDIRNLLGVYAPTLKSVKPGENILVAVELSIGFGSEDKTIVFKLPKKAVESARSEEDIKNKIEIIRLFD